MTKDSEEQPPAEAGEALRSRLARSLHQPRIRWSAAVVMVGMAALFMSRMTAHPSSDDNTRLQAVLALSDGDWFTMKYSMVMPLLAILPYRLAEVVGRGASVLHHFDLLVWVPWSLFVAHRLERLRGTRFAVGVVAMSSVSMFTAYVTSFNAEALSLMLVSAGMLLLADQGGTRSRIAGTVLVALGAAIIPVQVAGLAVLGVVHVVRRRSPWVLSAVVLAAVMVVADVAITEHRLGFSKYAVEVKEFEVLPWGTVQNFGYPLVFGLLGILFTFGRGLVWYMPSLFLGNERPHDPVVEWRRSLTVIVFVMVPIYAKWWAWYGGVAFGPRFFMLGVVPAAVAMCDRLQSPRGLRAWAVGVVATAFTGWVAIAAAVHYLTPAARQRCSSNNALLEPLCWYSPEYSSLFSPLWDGRALSAIQVLFMLGAYAVVAVVVVALSPAAIWQALRTRVRTATRNAVKPKARTDRPSSVSS